MKPSALLAEDLEVHYGKIIALEKCTLTIPQGTLTAIMGPNGAGKSTFLKTAVGLIKPHRGSLKVLGGTLKQNRKKIGYIPQKESVDWDFPLTLFDLVLMGCYKPFGLLRQVDKRRAWQCLEGVGLENVADRQIGELSGGQQQRAFLARALAQEAELYFMDEPLNGIDIHSKEMIIALLKKMVAEGKTVVMVHHDLAALPIFDWVVLLNKRVMAAGAVGENVSPQVIHDIFATC